MVCILHEDYGKIILNIRDGMKKFDKEDLESITVWCTTAKNSSQYARIPVARPLPQLAPPALSLARILLASTTPLGNI